ncbi:penicillin acylase family protein [Nocardiopsis flavescens]|uniref:penicillin acylase family protein n=1 Tax=Nocardiopsis flavescens TaxID=758803 RepID=UPI0015BDD9AF|nr:penicillin acylase family protein [Nocardiopsis flavescens]
MGVLRKRVLVRVLLGVLSTVVVLALVGALLGVWTVRRSFPQTTGELALPGLNAEVTVLRDGNGVPHVYADDAQDLFTAQGYVHAQDRFWEMDFRRHVTSGRTAELFGEAQVDTDVYLRTMGWRHVAEQEYDLLSADTRGYLDAYAAGVNAWLEENDGAGASLEYALLGVLNGGHTIEPWDPVDSLAWLKAMAWDLGGNMREETERAQLLGLGFTEERIAELYPEYPYEQHRPITDTDELATEGPGGDPGDARRAPELPAQAVSAVEAVYERALALPEMLGPRSTPDLGSNSWVVGGEHTESGLPLLANDPHLGASMPSTWHQVGLHCTELGESCPFDVAGFGFAGLPGVVIGQNESISWGFTNLNPDVMDLFVERVEGDSYIVDGEERPLETRAETVRVAGGEDVEFTVRSTHHGPLLSDTAAGEDLAGIAGDPPVEGAEEGAEYGVALQWTALSPGTTADALFVMNRARDWEDFRRAAAGFTVPAQNLVYADGEGNIGYQAPGAVPVRGEGDGRYPAPGWDSAYDWDEYIPFEDLPSVYNPESGFIVTANQSGVDADYPHFLTDDWDYGYRSQRINDLLEEAVAEGPVTGADMSEIHMDSYHLGAEAIVPHLLEADVEGTAAQGRELLRDWDLYTEPDSAGAAFYQATWRHLLPLLFEELDPVSMTGNSRGMYVVGGLLEDPGSSWWEGEGASGRDAVLAAAMEAAAAELTDLLGEDPADWRWGDLHTLTATHQSFGTSGIGAVEWLFNRGPVESSGGSAIVNATGWDDKEGYGITAVPSMRMVIDMSDRDASTWIHLTGNSGHAFHPHYDDQLEPWSRGETMSFAFTEDAVRAAAVDELTLTP